MLGREPRGSPPRPKRVTRLPMRDQPSPRVDLVVTEDPVTGTWTLTLHGHRIEIERTHGFVKVDGTLHHAPFVQNLHEVKDLARALASLATLLPGTPTLPIPSPPPLLSQQRAAQEAPATVAPQPAVLDEQRERPTPQPRRRAVQATRTPPTQRAEPSAESDERTVLPTERAAAYLGLSPKTLETLRTRGGGPPFLKLGRRVVYRKADLELWLAQRVRRSTSDPGQQ